MIAIIDYGINDTDELCKCLSKMGILHKVTRDEKEIIASDKVIISNSQNLKKTIKKFHLFNLFSLLRLLKKPTLGIALGMDLFCDNTDDGIACLGLVHTCAIHEAIKEAEINIPQMKKIKCKTKHKLFSGITDKSFFFEDKYHLPLTDSTIAVLENDNNYSVAIEQNNFYGVQFIPEKSGKQGMKLLENFANLKD